MSEFICSKCGSTNVVVNAARPAIDDRYAMGRCLSEAKGDKPAPERTLVRRDVRMLAQIEARDERARKKRLVTRFRHGTLSAKPGSPLRAKQEEEAARLIKEGW